MTATNEKAWNWVWPSVGASPVHQGLDSEMFDRTDYPYSETFVREAIQNSLDARLEVGSPVVVSFDFHSEKIGTRRPFLETAIQHRKDAGLPIPDEWEKDNVRWLVVEDSNAKGLGGDLTRRSHDFWGYWLNFGLSNKDGAGRGGRGIGRVTFLIASQMQTVVGLTRRAEDNLKAACGMMVLRAQERGDQMKSSHAYLAEMEAGSIFKLHDTGSFHLEMREAFHFDGYNCENDSGLALAILYPHDELTADKVLAAAIENFAPSIISNALELRVDGRLLNASNIDQVAQDTVGSFNDEGIKRDIPRFLNLIRKADAEDEPHLLKIKRARRAELETLRDSQPIASLQKKLRDGEDVVLELEFPLKTKHGEAETSLRVIARRNDTDGKPIDRLFREGMSLPDVTAGKPTELDIVILVKPGDLATYLNFCEGKAHLDLLESNDVKDKLEARGFGDHPHVKRLVKALPIELRSLLTPNISSPVKEVFEDFFSRPVISEEKKAKTKKKKDIDKEDDNVEPKERKAPALLLEDVQGGFRITSNRKHTNWPVAFMLEIAYADGSRKPKWSPLDFNLNDLKFVRTGCETTSDKNRVIARNWNLDSALEVTGFDTNRELDTNIRMAKNA